MTQPQLPDAETVLEAGRIRLEPLSPGNLQELAPRLRQREVFAGGFGGGLAAMPDTDAGFVSFFTGYSPMHRAGRSYAVLLDGEAVGTTSLYKCVPEVGSVAIGYTAYAPSVWATGVNPATKRLLLETLFAAGFNRVEFEVAGGNARSRAAVAKLGAHEDGVLRQARRLADGRLDDTVVFSILAAEWPRVREGLTARIG